MSEVLNLGCGHRPLEAALNHDLRAHSEHVGIAHDLEELPWPWEDEAFRRIVAHDVMEHLRLEVEDWLDECWRILEPGGELEIRGPAWDRHNAWRDPTHVRPFEERMFDYWDPETEIGRKYGELYFGETARWWRVVGVERVDGGTNLLFRLEKRA